MLLAGRAEVDVRIDEAREEVHPLGRDRLRPLRRGQRAGRAQLGDLAVAHEHVAGAVEAGARVEHVGAADQQLGGASAAEVETLDHQAATALSTSELTGSGALACAPASSS